MIHHAFVGATFRCKHMLMCMYVNFFVSSFYRSYRHQFGELLAAALLKLKDTVDNVSGCARVGVHGPHVLRDKVGMVLG